MNHTSEEEIPKTEIEMFTRVAIFDTYCRTTLYKDHYKRYHTKLTEKYKKYSMSRDGTTADSYTPVDFINDADNIVERLHEDSLVPHQLYLKLEGIVNMVESSSYSIYNKNIIGWELVAVSTADHLPFEIKEPYSKTNIHTLHNADSGFMTIQFDLDVGLDKQLKGAKVRLQKQRDIYKKSFQEGGKVGTSRYDLDLILENLKCLVFRDNEQDKEKEVSEKFGMPYGTFRDKCNKALALIRSKKIVRFFPK